MMLMLLAMDAKLSDLDLQSFNRAAHEQQQDYEEKLKYANCHMPRSTKSSDRYGGNWIFFFFF